MNPASISDLEARWRTLTDLEQANANAFLDDAWALLASRRPSIEVDMDAGTVSEDNVIRVICAMVLRVMRNPDGFSSETIDDYTYRRDDSLAGGLLYVTPDELADITPGRARNRSVRLVIYGETA